jgi:hypothetical protein
MARFNYRVTHDPNGTATVLDNVQSLTITRGRTQVQDPFKAGTASISGRVPSGLPTVNIGDEILVQALSSVGTILGSIFIGKVADLRLQFGEVTNMDTWIIYAEDALAEAGRALTTASGGFAAGDTTWEAAEKIALDAGIPLVLVAGSTSGSTVSAQSLPNTNALNVLQQLVFTEQGRIYTDPTSNDILWVDRGTITPYDIEFTDGTLVTFPNTVSYSELQFYSQADSYFTKIVIQPDGSAAQVSGSGERVFSANSFDETTSQAGNLADYVGATLSVQNAKPQSISILSESQINNECLRLFFVSGSNALSRVILRGSSYEVFLEGATLTGNPDQTRITYNLVSADALSFFILDSTTLGVLDQNKLGF